MALRPAPVRRRALSMTSLIDVIFLLLLFFMLSSTFSRFAEIPLAAAAGGAQMPVADARLIFLRLAPDEALLNGRPVALADLPARLDADPDPRDLLVGLSEGVTAQRLTDLLVVLAPLDHIHVKVLQ